MRITNKNIKIILIVVISVCIIETAFMVKKNYGGEPKEESSEVSSIDNISEEDIENLLNNKLIIKPLEDDFKIIQPEKNNYVTGENFVTFTGMSDPNENLKINDEEVPVYYTGNFVLKYPLKEGDNKITFTLGDKESEYNINKVNGIIDYISPGETLQVENNMKAEITAKIYSGAEAYAIVGNKKIELTQVQSDEELQARGTSYADFKGYLDTSEYSEGTSLGKVTVYASLDGENSSKEGPEVRINTKENKVRVATVNKDSAALYDVKTTSNIPLNDIYPLAKGTKDYITSKIVADNKVYYNLASGKRVKEEDVDVAKFEDLSNNINSLEVSEDSRYVYVSLDSSKKAPYTFISENVNYKDKEKENYEVDNFSLNEIKIYLDYVKEIKNNISYLNNDFFTSVTFEEDDKGKYLSLKLKDKNSYNGHFTYYDSNGRLVFRFLKKSNSLKDMTIVIDPGHGLIGEDKLDTGALGFNDINENTLNMQIAKKLFNLLNNEGANAILLYTDSTPYALKERGKQAREKDADLFISLHNNSGASGQLNAVETYYFTPYSKVFAENINKSLVKCYENELFPKEDNNYDRGAKYNNYTVTLERENPSILIETGYIDNPKAFNKLIDEGIQTKIAKYIVKGIEESIS